MRVTAVHPGFIGNQQINVGDFFDIPDRPLNPKTGLPILFSDWRKRVAPGRSGWMKPHDDAAMKQLLAMEAAFAKGLPAPELPAAPALKPEDDPVALRALIAKLQAQLDQRPAAPPAATPAEPPVQSEATEPEETKETKKSKKASK